MVTVHEFDVFNTASDTYLSPALTMMMMVIIVIITIMMIIIIVIVITTIITIKSISLYLLVHYWP